MYIGGLRMGFGWTVALNNLDNVSTNVPTKSALYDGISEYKCCGTCNELKPLCEFSSNKKRSDGYDFRCRSCKREYYKFRKTINAST